MTSPLQDRFDKLRQQKEALILEFSAWPPERLRVRPDPATWSIQDVFDHLAKTEKDVFAMAQANLSKSHPIRLRDRLGTVFMDFVMKSPMRVKVPAGAKQVMPNGQSDFLQILKDWGLTRDTMARNLSQATPEQLRGGVFCHPVTGWMTLPQTLNFLSAHMTHHTYQLNRLKRL